MSRGAGLNSHTGELTSGNYWNSYWRDRFDQLPLEIRRHGANLQTRAILDVLDAFPPPAGASVLEVGGAPGRYLAYIHRQCGCRCAILDYSAPACALARENFRLLGISLDVYEHDIFADAIDERFDLVYSLGLIEHFDDYAAVVKAQAELVKPGGLLLVGVPNFRGVNGWLARCIDRPRFESHNLEAMNSANWNDFEQRLGLECLFREYVGGFEPIVFATKAASDDLQARLLSFCGRQLSRLLTYHFGFLRRVNRPWLSGYLIGVWRAPEAS